MRKVVKFGGSSLADACQMKKVVDIIRADESRMYVVPSAPGKRFKGDVKVTDMLIRCYEIQKRDVDEGHAYFYHIQDRYDEIISGLGLDFSLEDEYREIHSAIDEGMSEEYLVSRGEYLNGKVLAAALGYRFIDPADYVVFDAAGNYDENRTVEAFYDVDISERFVMPGFYGAAENGRIKTFSRGGSDITGSIVAKAMKVDVYENWTDVSGFLAADPRIIENPAGIQEISYSELRELSYMGASVFHEEAIFPARSEGIPINIRNTNRPEDEGSWIVPDDKITEAHSFITGITGKTDFTALSFEKDIGSDRLGFGRKVLQVFEESKVMVEHVPSSIGTMTVLVDDKELEGKEENILRRIRREIDPYNIKVEHDLALVAIVGESMYGAVGAAAEIFRVLAAAGVNVKLSIQGINEISCVVGVAEDDFETSIKALYSYAEACNRARKLIV
ncbi:MAG: aspartate kinase [Lachnospiraceae bacterium]|nr:aspartate kinase [Lachnospiraceae bacterium]